MVANKVIIIINLIRWLHAATVIYPAMADLLSLLYLLSVLYTLHHVDGFPATG